MAPLDGTNDNDDTRRGLRRRRAAWPVRHLLALGTWLTFSPHTVVASAIAAHPLPNVYQFGSATQLYHAVEAMRCFLRDRTPDEGPDLILPAFFDHVRVDDAATENVPPPVGVAFEEVFDTNVLKRVTRVVDGSSILRARRVDVVEPPSSRIALYAARSNASVSLVREHFQYNLLSRVCDRTPSDSAHLPALLPKLRSWKASGSDATNSRADERREAAHRWDTQLSLERFAGTPAPTRTLPHAVPIATCNTSCVVAPAAGEGSGPSASRTSAFVPFNRTYSAVATRAIANEYAVGLHACEARAAKDVLSGQYPDGQSTRSATKVVMYSCSSQDALGNAAAPGLYACMPWTPPCMEEANEALIRMPTAGLWSHPLRLGGELPSALAQRARSGTLFFGSVAHDERLVRIFAHLTPAPLVTVAMRRILADLRLSSYPMPSRRSGPVDFVVAPFDCVHIRRGDKAAECNDPAISTSKRVRVCPPDDAHVRRRISELAARANATRPIVLFSDDTDFVARTAKALQGVADVRVRPSVAFGDSAWGMARTRIFDSFAERLLCARADFFLGHADSVFSQSIALWRIAQGPQRREGPPWFDFWHV